EQRITPDGPGGSSPARRTPCPVLHGRAIVRDGARRKERCAVIALVWQFDVKPGKNSEFEAFYGADGPWTALSRRSRSYLGSSFLRDIAMPQRYLVVEYWSEMVVYEKHHADYQDEMKALETHRESLVEG